MSEPKRPLRWRPHPWHGLSAGEQCPEVVNAYVEIVPTDGVKYEVDKHSGYLLVDRPQRLSSACPTLYGFVPRTYCGARVAREIATGGTPLAKGDEDPLDVCVLTDRNVTRGEILLRARPIGGLRMVERGEADDKILAVLLGDPTYGEIAELDAVPRAVVDRLRHYFLSYKTIPGEPQRVAIESTYGAAAARRVIEASRADYAEAFPGLELE